MLLSVYQVLWNRMIQQKIPSWRKGLCSPQHPFTQQAPTRRKVYSHTHTHSPHLSHTSSNQPKYHAQLHPLKTTYCIHIFICILLFNWLYMNNMKLALHMKRCKHCPSPIDNTFLASLPRTQRKPLRWNRANTSLYHHKYFGCHGIGTPFHPGCTCTHIWPGSTRDSMKIVPSRVLLLFPRSHHPSSKHPFCPPPHWIKRFAEGAASSSPPAGHPHEEHNDESQIHPLASHGAERQGRSWWGVSLKQAVCSPVGYSCAPLAHISATMFGGRIHCQCM